MQSVISLADYVAKPQQHETERSTLKRLGGGGSDHTRAWQPEGLFITTEGKTLHHVVDSLTRAHL